ncbi:MAG: hypothetical protein ABI601_02770 [bacterium]
MSTNTAQAGRAQIGVALDGTLLSAVWSTTLGAPWRTLVVPCDGTPGSIAEALRALAEQAPARADVAFTLQRPLATARTIALPNMRRAELEAVLARDWSRHVIGLRAEPHLVAVASSDGSGRWRAAFAPVATLEALETGAREHGWRVRDVRITDDALAAAAREAMPTLPRIDDALVVLSGVGNATDVTHLRRGEPIAGRQLIVGSAAEIAAFARGSLSRVASAPNDALRSATIMVLGDRARSETLARELGREGLKAQHLPIARLASESPAALLAAAALLHPAHLPLVAPSERVTRTARTRVATRWLVAATIALIAAGFAIENHRVSVALDDVARRRAAIAPRVSDAVARRTRLESATETASALASREAQASHASSAIAAIALSMPDNASLSMLQVMGDSVSMEGEGDRAAGVYAALRSAPTLQAVRLAGPLRQERQADDTPVERFAFVARLRKDER